MDIEISAEQATMRRGILMIRDKEFQVPEITSNVLLRIRGIVCTVINVLTVNPGTEDASKLYAC